MSEQNGHPLLPEEPTPTTRFMIMVGSMAVAGVFIANGVKAASMNMPGETADVIINGLVATGFTGLSIFEWDKLIHPSKPEDNDS